MTPPQPQRSTTEGAHLVLYDGVCGLCDHLVRFILERDGRGVFRFAALQSAAARSALEPFAASADELTTLHVIANYRSASARHLTKGRASLFVLSQLGWPWKAAAVLRPLPAAIFDGAYDLVARHRYRIAGRHEQCLAPSLEYRNRFLESSADVRPGPGGGA